MEDSGHSSSALASDLRLWIPRPETEEDAGDVEIVVMTLFEQYRAPLLRYALSAGVPVPDAEEILQEVFLALFRHLRLGRSRKNLRGWIFRVAHNLTLKRRHENKRRVDLMENIFGSGSLLPDPSLNPEERYSSAERQRRLLAVVEALPELEKRCLWLRAEGLGYREIAGVLGISLGSVAAFLARSLGKLIRVDQG